MRIFTGNTANRKRISAIGSHINLCCFVMQTQKFQRIGTKFRVKTQRREHQNTTVIFTNPQLSGRSNHTGRLMSIGFTGGNGEVSGQYGAGKSYYDFVADLEVVGTADNTLHAGFFNAFAGESLCLSFGNYTHLAPIHGLTVGVSFGLQ